ncbi:MAG: aldo/keto reductase [Oscillospiraceae bacterium]|jgi:predicted aldo/keto reductase-like oxidoreductase|nr:aldo/keto reductase [Oscillospiraceae bacterium]
MQYRDDLKGSSRLSALGFGCMRFPRGMTGRIDLAKAERLIVDAVEDGVNYFDTAYIYGGSEEALGEILAKNNLREKVNIATKLPPAKCGTYEDFEALFKTALGRLQTTYIDYYLIHNISTLSLWNRLLELGIERWIAEKKASGEIRRIGFSFHGSLDSFLELLNAYDWDFCQIQYNYLNPNDQAGVDGLKAAAAKGLPVIIMEPLLGGKLAVNLPQRAVDLFKEVNANRSAAEWALRWLWDQPEVTVVLSGMNSPNQLSENVAVASDAKVGSLTDAERAVYEPVRAVIMHANKVGCTGCGYCMPCPAGVNIPGCFMAYNMSYALSYFEGMKNYLTTAGMGNPEGNSGARKCVGCGKCKSQCPQRIAIPDELRRVANRLEPFWVRAGVSVVLWQWRRRG